MIPIDNSTQREGVSDELNELSRLVVDAAYCVHSTLGPGLLESVYEACLCHELEKRNILFQRQVSLPVVYDGITYEEGYSQDIWLGEIVIV